MAQRPIACMAKYGFALLSILVVCFAPAGSIIHEALAQTGVSASEQRGSREDAAAAVVDCGRLAVMVQEQKSLLTRETGQLKREIAALRDDLSRPGIKEVFAGIGYIFGLAGVGLYAHNRRTGAQGKSGKG